MREMTGQETVHYSGKKSSRVKTTVSPIAQFKYELIKETGWRSLHPMGVLRAHAYASFHVFNFNVILWKLLI